MIRAITSLLVTIAVFFLSSGTMLAQDKQQQNNSAFEKVTALINKQDAAGIWALTSEDFKSHIGWGNFENFAKYGMFSQGTVSASSLTGFKDGISDFKATFSTGDFSIKVSVDSQDKINYFLFKKINVGDPVKTNQRIPNTQLTGIDKVIEDAATEYINKGNTVGLSVGFLQKGVMRSYSYGETEKGSGELPGAHSAFEIGSITKTFTATLLAWYANAGKVALKDPITKYLPDSVKKNKNLQGITLQMLSNHTSGLARVPDNLFTGNKNPQNPYKNYDRKKLYGYLKHCKPETAPGTVMAYSNTAAGLLGTILEQVSGKKFAQMVESIIVDPMKLECTGIKFTGDHAPHVLPVYDEKVAPAKLWDFDALAGAGALRSTTGDLLKYAEANLDLNTSPLGKALALTHVITYDKEVSIGLGWFKKSIGKNVVYWHNGGTYGSSSFIAFIPGRGVAVVVLSNSAESVDGLAEKILSAVE